MRSQETEDFLREARLGHLATIDREGRPVVVPICFVYDGTAFYSSLDEKPKRAPPEKLGRARNIRANPEVALVLDRYDEDWSRLKFVLVRGRARILHSGKIHGLAVRMLREKYFQYRGMDLESRPVLKIVPWRIREWSAGGIKPRA